MDSPKRKRIRLPEYSYDNNGAYFVTICTKDRKNILWKKPPYSVGANSVRPKNMVLSTAGEYVDRAITNISDVYGSAVIVDKYVIMPNHIHMIILIDDNGRTVFAPTISRIIKQFKGVVTKQTGKSIWQRSFYDHIIRDQQDYLGIWEYIDNNPATWLEDELYKE